MTNRILLRPDEAAQLLGISRSRCYELMNRGALPVFILDGTRRVPLDALNQLIAAGTDFSYVVDYDEEGQPRLVRP